MKKNQSEMKKLLSLFVALAGISAICNAQEADNWTTKVTFFSPSIVRIYKTGPDNPDKKQSLSVTMQPQQVKVSQSADKNGAQVYKSSALTVKVSGNSGSDFYSILIALIKKMRTFAADNVERFEEL